MKIRLSAWGKYAQDVQYILAALGDPWRNPANPIFISDVTFSAEADEKSFYVIIEASGLFSLPPASVEAGWRLMDAQGHDYVQLVFPIKRTTTDGAIIEGFTQPIMKGKAKGSPILKDATEIKEKITDELKLAARYELTKIVNYDQGTTETSEMAGSKTYNITQAIMNKINIDVIINKLNRALKSTPVSVTKDIRTLRGTEYNLSIAIEKGSTIGSARVYLEVPKQSGKLSGVTISSEPKEAVITGTGLEALRPGTVPDVRLSNGSTIGLIPGHIPRILADMFKDSPPIDNRGNYISWTIVLNNMPETDKRTICDDLTKAIRSTSGRPSSDGSPSDGSPSDLDYRDIIS
jgi:hypothetical protein